MLVHSHFQEHNTVLLKTVKTAVLIEKSNVNVPQNAISNFSLRLLQEKTNTVVSHPTFKFSLWTLLK